jgi:hypothetical protein
MSFFLNFLHREIEMAFNPLLPTGLDQNLIPVEVRAKYYEEVLLVTDLRHYMGANPMSAIQVAYKKMGSGDTYTVPFSKEIDYKNPVTGNFSQISGTGQVLDFYSDTLTVQFQSLVDKIQAIQFMQLDTPVEVFDALKPKLINAHTRNIVYQLLKSGTTQAYPNLATSGPVASRAIYGSQAYPGNGFIQTGINSMTAGTAYNQDGLSVAGIRQLRDYAIYGGTSFEFEKRISPAMLTVEKGGWVPTYIYLMDTPSYTALTQDPDWKGYFTRGTIESTINQPSGLKGAFFKGMIDNVEIYECPELGNFQQNSTDDTITVSWNLFMGAQAFLMTWGELPWFFIEYSNMHTVAEMAMMEIRGQKSLKFPSFNNPAVTVENGLIHHFVSIPQ